MPEFHFDVSPLGRFPIHFLFPVEYFLFPELKKDFTPERIGRLFQLLYLFSEGFCPHPPIPCFVFVRRFFCLDLIGVFLVF